MPSPRSGLYGQREGELRIGTDAIKRAVELRQNLTFDDQIRVVAFHADRLKTSAQIGIDWERVRHAGVLFLRRGSESAEFAKLTTAISIDNEGRGLRG